MKDNKGMLEQIKNSCRYSSGIGREEVSHPQEDDEEYVCGNSSRDSESESSGSEDDCDVSLSSSESERGLKAQDNAMLATSNHKNLYLPRETRAFAKYIAEIGLETFELSSRSRSQFITDFQTKYPRHSKKGWANFYHRKRKEIRSQIKRFMARNALRQSEAIRVEYNAVAREVGPA